MSRATELKESTQPRPQHARHQPEKTILYRTIHRYYSEFRDYMSEQGRSLPLHVQKEFDEYLKCGRQDHGFLRVQCSSCHHERLVAFSCKRRGFCPSCGARRMAESAALLVDEVLPHEPMRQWVLSFPFQLRFLFASRPELMGKVLGAGYCLSRNCIPPHQKGSADSENGDNRCSNTHSEIWKRIKLECPFPHAVPGWRIHKKQTRKDQDSSAP
ncbi:MAG: hypothetical protein GY781_01580 [Gammaproteobacteria bacterium]|nr:hypothetical protein [Gammaproteobacteria bacterium]